MAFVGFTKTQFESLDALLSEILSKIDNIDVQQALEDYLEQHPDAIGDEVAAYLQEHGINVGYSVTDGVLNVIIQ